MTARMGHLAQASSQPMAQLLARSAEPDMRPSLVLVIVIGILVAAGVYLVLERSLTRVLIGLILLGNGANLLFLVAGGAAGSAPIIGDSPPQDMSDPLPQAMVLTAIVITLSMTAFLLAMAYRSWQLHGHDEVQDDVEDRRIARLAEQQQVDEHEEHWLDEAAAILRDEMEAEGTDADADAAGQRSEGGGTP